MANNIVAGVNFVVSKISGSFAELNLTGTNIEEVYSTDGAGNLRSWKPGRTINTLTAITAGSGYLLNAKTSFENLDFMFPLIVPPVVTYDKTDTTITAHIIPSPNATSYRIDYTWTGGSSYVITTDLNQILDPLTPNTAYTITVKGMTAEDIVVDYGVVPQTITTNP